MYARFVTVLSGGRADSVRPCVPKWRFRASVIRRGSGERPRDNSPRPSAESDLDMVNRYMVFQDAASDGASMDGIPRDANDRRWLAGPAPALPSTGATTIAKQPKHTVRWAKEPIRTSEYAQLVAQGKILEQEVSSRRPG